MHYNAGQNIENIQKTRVRAGAWARAWPWTKPMTRAKERP